MIRNFGGNYTMNGMWNPYNPTMSAPQRLAQMEQQYMQNTYGSMMQNPLMLKGRAVSSFEEARAAMIDLDGSLHIFPDINNKMIYTKQVNLDGTSSLNVYKLVENNQNKNTQENMSPFVSLNVFDDAIDSLQGQINDLSNLIKQRSVKHENVPRRKSNDGTANDVLSVTE